MSVKILNLRDNPLYVFQVQENPENNLIKQEDINAAKNDGYVNTTRHRQDFGDKDSVYIKAGKKKHSLILQNNNNDYELQIEVVDNTNEKVFSEKPHPSTETAWDEKVSVFFQCTSKGKEKIEQYRDKDLQHIRTNLFVNPQFADIVESHITKTIKNIDKIEIEIKKIQNDYKKLKDEEVVL